MKRYLKNTDMKTFLPLVLLFTGCSFGSMDFTGKDCDKDHPCPSGYLCVTTPTSIESVRGECYEEQGAPGCTEGDLSCAQGRQWVQKCDPDGHSWSIHVTCDNETYCNPDILACSEACESDEDCPALHTCDLGTFLCRPFGSCGSDCEGLCVDDSCVARPLVDVQAPYGLPDLNCFSQEITSPPSFPETCSLTGRITMFPLMSESSPCAGLTVRLLDADPPHQVLMESSAMPGDDSEAYYRFDGVHTNRNYIIEVPSGIDGQGRLTVTTLSGVISVRADDCTDGQMTRGISVVSKSLYDTYTSQTIENLQPHRGLVIGRVLDCNEQARLPLGNVTVGLAVGPVSPGRIYYFANESYLMPDLSLEATSIKGYWAAVGVPAVMNEAGFLARQSSTDIILGSVRFFLLPDSVAIVNLTLPSQRLVD